jgi:hypothetical protein
MPWPFKSAMKAQERADAEKIVAHVQRLIAYQQLTMEVYNDALASVSNRMILGDELFERSQAELADPELVRQVLLPAVSRKLDLIERMMLEHGVAVALFDKPASKRLYALFSDLLRAMQIRAKMQHEGFSLWADDPTIVVDTTLYDTVEARAVNAALLEQNRLLERAGWLNPESFLAITCHATNTVRADLELEALSEQRYQELYLQGLAGDRPRLFT